LGARSERQETARCVRERCSGGCVGGWAHASGAWPRLAASDRSPAPAAPGAGPYPLNLQRLSRFLGKRRNVG
jgi:hypothetical protein